MDSITSATSILGGTKFKIQQSVPCGSIKRGPLAIVRTADLNDGIEIKRRFGEGSKPLFARDDITVNQRIVDVRDSSAGHDQSFGCKSKSIRRSSSTESSSPERYRHRENKSHSSPVSSRNKSPERSTYTERPNHYRDKYAYNSKFNSTKTDKYRRREKSKSRSPSPVKKKPAQKLPYYRDEKREKDRLKRLYGHSRSHSPPSISGKKSSPIAKRRIESPSRRRRSKSRDRNRRYSPLRSFRRDYRSHKSRSPSVTRSQRHERHKHTNRNLEKSHKEDSSSIATALIPATPQYIPIPVAVPADYTAYSFPGWSPPPPWHPSPHRPPPAPHFTPFPIWPMVPPIRPPFQASYTGIPPALSYTPMTAQYRPHSTQRFLPPRQNTNNYQSRPKKPSS